MSTQPMFPSSLLKIGRAAGCAIVAVLALTTVSFGQCSYEVTVELAGPPCLPGHPASTFATGLSDNGIVVGRYEICSTIYTEAFMWVPNDDGEGGVFTTLPRPANVISASAVGVNSHGIVIGSHSVSGVGPMGFVYDPATGEFKYLDPLHDGVSWTPATTATAINDDNIVTGSRIISEPGVSPPISNAVIWFPYGEDGDGREIIVDLGVGDGPNSGAFDGNDGTDAAGWSGTDWHTSNAKAVLWTGGVTLDLGVLPGATTAHSDSTNNYLEVVGESRDPSSFFRGFYWYKGKMIELEPPPPFERFRPEDISDTGQIVGSFLPPASNHAALLQHGEYHQIESLVINPPLDFKPSTAGNVNAKGQIRASRYLLTPVNVPTGDLNFDCAVDVYDLVYLLNEWGKSGSNADLNGNGTVGVADLLILLANWGS